MQAQPNCTHVASKLASTVVVSMGRPKRFKISQSIKYSKCFPNTTFLDSVLCMGKSETTSMPCQVALLALIVTSKHPISSQWVQPCCEPPAAQVSGGANHPGTKQDILEKIQLCLYGCTLVDLFWISWITIVQKCPQQLALFAAPLPQLG